MLGGGAINLAEIDVVGQNNADASGAKAGALAAQRAHRLQKSVALRDFKFQKLQIGFALFFQIAQRGDAPIFQDQDLVTAFFNIAQQMRRNQNADLAGVANLTHQLQHADTRFRIQAVGGLVQ